MPISVLYQGLSKILGRPVYTHEFADRNRLFDEIEGKIPRSSFDDDVIGLLEKYVPKENILIAVVGEENV